MTEIKYAMPYWQKIRLMMWEETGGPLGRVPLFEFEGMVGSRFRPRFKSTPKTVPSQKTLDKLVGTSGAGYGIYELVNLISEATQQFYAEEPSEDIYQGVDWSDPASVEAAYDVYYGDGFTTHYLVYYGDGFTPLPDFLQGDFEPGSIRDIQKQTFMAKDALSFFDLAENYEDWNPISKYLHNIEAVEMSDEGSYEGEEIEWKDLGPSSPIDANDPWRPWGEKEGWVKDPDAGGWVPTGDVPEEPKVYGEEESVSGVLDKIENILSNIGEAQWGAPGDPEEEDPDWDKKNKVQKGYHWLKNLAKRKYRQQLDLRQYIGKFKNGNWYKLWSKQGMPGGQAALIKAFKLYGYNELFNYMQGPDFLEAASRGGYDTKFDQSDTSFLRSLSETIINSSEWWAFGNRLLEEHVYPFTARKNVGETSYIATQTKEGGHKYFSNDAVQNLLNDLEEYSDEDIMQGGY